MPRYSYTARDAGGQTVSADVEAPSRKDAFRLLAARGLQVGRMLEAGGPAPAGRKAPGAAAAAPAKAGGFHFKLSSARGTPPARGDRLPFLESLHDLTTSGLSAGEAVRLLSVRLKEPRLRTLSGGLWERISEGAPLSRAMATFPAVFDSATINLVQAGEATGSVNDTLGRLISHLTDQRELRRKLMNAMAYPIFIVFIAGGVILFFLFFLLPRLQSLFDSLHGKMPQSTVILIAISNFCLHYGIFIIAALIFFAVAAWRWRSTEAGRLTSDAWLLKLPLVGPFLIARTVHSFSQTLSVLLENGITASEALRMTERQIQNRVHRQAFNSAIARVLEGEALSAALGRTGCMPDLVLDRLAVGENTGNVVPSLRDVARTQQKMISAQLDLFTQVFASAFLLGVFVFVGFIAFAIVSAIFSASASFEIH
ncbi:MAG TPA: type II secretion system F family protein [Opitutaceae bacterium]|jgi:type II secretory pathway component PulF|nr:type II secretion system F family protein [Opitutaceae bacterium]